MEVKEAITRFAQQGCQLFLAEGKLKVKALKGALTVQDKQYIADNKVDIVRYLEEQIPLAKVPDDLKILPTENVGQLSFAQQRLWFIDQLNDGSPEYNMPFAFEVVGLFDIKIAEEALSHLVERHQILRTVYLNTDSGVTTKVQPARHFKIQHIELTSSDHLHAQQERDSLLSSEVWKSFDLSRDLMLRVSFIEQQGKRGILVFNMHHIASDGWSLQLLTNEFMTLYKSFAEAKPCQLPDLALQYSDYAHWQREYLQGERLNKLKSYWRQQLGDAPPLHGLNLDKPRPEVKSNKGKIFSQVISNETLGRLIELAKEFQLTPFMILHGALSLALSRYCLSDDIVVGTPVANREQEALSRLVGLFVNSIALRLNTSAQPVSEFLKSVREVHLDAQQHQSLPFEQLVEMLDLDRTTAYTPVFQIWLTLNEHYEFLDNEKSSHGGLSLSPIDMQDVTSKFDLHIDMTLSTNGLNISWVYDFELFDESSIVALSKGAEQVIAQLGKHTLPESTKDITVLSDERKRVLLYDYNDTYQKYDQSLCIHQLFERQAKLTPSNIAIEYGEDSLTYRELDSLSNVFSQQLIANYRVQPGAFVGLMVERSLEQIVALMAILKAGAVYVPIEVSLPELRKQYMVENASIELVLCHQAYAETLGTTAIPILSIDSLLAIDTDVDTQHADATVNRVSAESPAYCIYTSGSTGQPKGAVVSHQALHNRIDWMHREYGADVSDVILHKTPISFDVSVWELIWPLVSGAKLLIAKPQGHQNIEYLCELIQEKKVTKCHFVPSVLNLFLESDKLSGCKSLQQVFASGEALQVAQVKKFKSRLSCAKLHNLYGPTEAAIDVSYWDCDGLEGDQIPIGKPIQNIQLLVLDKAQRLVPQGVAGELYIGGHGLALGYVNQSELTARSFISNPYYESQNVNSSERLYKTGDLVRMRADGNIEFLGREDDQVKINGLRIELGEIQEVIQSVPTVLSSYMTITDAKTPQLVAYVMTERSASDAEPVRDYILAQISDRLPEYMLPRHIVEVSNWPLTVNGKLDYRALPKVQVAESDIQGDAPEGVVQVELAQLWAELLEIPLDRIGVETSFFALGGHSLLLMQLNSLLLKRGYTSVNGSLIQTLLNNPTIKGMDNNLVKRQEVGYQPQANLIPDNTDLITPEMLNLIELSQSQIDTICALVTGGASNIADIYPVLPLQEGMLFIHTLREKIDPFVTVFAMELSSREILQHVIGNLNQVIKRHDALRTLILWKQVEPAVQVVLKSAEIPVEFISIDEQLDAKAVALSLVEQGQNWLDVEQAPMLALKVIEDPSSGMHYALLLAHHLVVDHLSIEIILEEIQQLGESGVASLKAAPQYREFVGQVLHQQKERDSGSFFSDMLSDVNEQTVPFGLAEAISDGMHVKDHRETIPLELARQIRSLSKSLEISAASIFHTVWGIVLGACSNKQDVVFGTVLSGRMNDSENINRIVGMMTNTLPFRVAMSDLSVKDTVLEVDGRLRALLYYEQTSLTVAQSYSGIASGTPLFSSIINYRHSSKEEDLERDESTSVELSTLTVRERSNYKFDFCVNDEHEGFSYDLLVDDSICVTTVANYINEALRQVVSMLEANSVEPVSRVCVLPEEIQLQVVSTQSTITYPQHRIEKQFELMVGEQPNAVAVCDSKITMTYAQLDIMSNRLANYFIEVGYEQQNLAISLDNSVCLLVAVLAIWKSGNTYIALDAKLPEQRLQHIISDAQTELVLTDSHSGRCKAFIGMDIISMEDLYDDEHWLSEFPSAKPPCQSSDLSQDAYVLYTSGSTGEPKGVRVSHANLSNYIGYARRTYLSEDINQSVTSTVLGFDATVTSYLVPLIDGVTVNMVSAQQDNLAQVAELMVHPEPKLFKLTPAHLEALNYHFDPNMSFAHQHCFVIGGEQLTSTHLLNWKTRFPSATYFNEYGPTEATVGCCVYQVDLENDISEHEPSNILIGKPIDNTRLFIFNDAHTLLPYGVSGELFIAGDCITNGYLNNDEETQKRFIASSTIGEVLYKTGDLAKLHANGQLEYVGRLDNQVHIRGFRVELSEVEAQLCLHSDVANAIVICDGDSSESKKLCAAIMLNEGLEAHSADLDMEKYRTFLRKKLPEYMIPNVFICIDNIPLTRNGKIDVCHLKALFSVQDTEIVEAENETEEIFLGIWRQVLPQQKFGVMDSFFNLGGNSLLALKLISLLNQKGFEITIGDIWKFETIRNIVKNRLINVQNEVVGTECVKDLSDVYEVESFKVDFELAETQLRHQIAVWLKSPCFSYSVDVHKLTLHERTESRSRQELNRLIAPISEFEFTLLNEHRVPLSIFDSNELPSVAVRYQISDKDTRVWVIVHKVLSMKGSAEQLYVQLIQRLFELSE